MLDAFFYSGAVAGGAMVGLGLIGRSAPDGSDRNPQVRSLGVLMGAFAAGLGIIAGVVGLLAVFDTVGDSAEPLAAAMVTLVPAAVLGIPGLLIGRPAERTEVQGITGILTAFSVAVGLVAVLVAAMAFLLLDGGGTSEIGIYGLLLGVAGSGAVMAVGYVGAAGVRTAAQASPDVTPAEAQALRGPIVVRAAMAEGIGILTAVGAMLVALGVVD